LILTVLLWVGKPILDTYPMDKIEEFSGMKSVINLGVKNLEDFKLGSSSTMMGGGGG